MPVLTRSQSKRAKSNDISFDKKTKSKTKSKKKVKAKQVKSNQKRSRKEKDKEKENISTPPNKKKKRNKQISKPVTPSKELAKLLSDIDIDRKEKEEIKDDDDIDDDIDNEIILIQERLLTQEMDINNNGLIGRENEYNKIYKFIDKQLSLNKGNSLYICGSPGTGKTATIQSIINIFKSKSNVEIIKLNGMSLNNPSSIYPLIYNDIFDNDDNIKPIDAKNKLEKYFLKKSNNNDNKMYIIIIDEMDGLLTNNIRQQVLYHLFGWTKQKNCKFILFGIANSIDLTDRFLPRLKQRNFEPELLIFKPYTNQQLIKIIKHRIGKDVINKYFDDIAINLCATKIAKMYGDVRKCLEICRNALNLLLTNKNIKKISFIEMKQILSSSFESPLIDIIKNLPNHQKTIIVLSSILINKNKNCKYLIYNNLEKFYQFMSKKYILPKTSPKEFNTIIDSLIADNIFEIDKNNNNKNKTRQKIILLSNDTKLQLMIPHHDIKFAVQNDDILNKFFQIDINIPKKYIN